MLPSPLWLTDDILKRLRAYFSSARNVVIFSHRRPDGDTIGANLALAEALKLRGVNVKSVCVDPIPVAYRGFTDMNAFVSDFDKSSVDLYIGVDGSSTSQLVFPQQFPEILDDTVPFISIDHHISNTRFGTLPVVVPDACSTTFVLFYILQELGWHITPSMATYLLLGLYYDTGSFMHQNTTEEVMSMACELMRYGADRAGVVRMLYASKRVAQLKLLGAILERMQKMDDGTVLSGLMNSDFVRERAISEDTNGAVDYLASLKDGRFSVLLSEDRVHGVVKGSARTRRDDVDMSVLSGKFGGGGHAKASGFGIPGQLVREERVRVLGEDGKDVEFPFALQ